LLKNIFVGTSGHVEHGKTTIATALTGIYTDRVFEKKSKELLSGYGFLDIN
jgi:selenocysteine-specific elongation factor